MANMTRTTDSRPTSEAARLRPVATWVTLPDESGRQRLTQIWTVPDPVASFATLRFG